MSASTHWLATGTAQSVLERGGNAFDAAVAAAFVLHLVEPHLNGPGGDLTAILATAEDPGTPVVLMGQGPAPAGATLTHFAAEGLDLVPGSGALAAAVPGATDAWLLLLETHGTWELRDVLTYAVDIARDGHPLSAGVARSIASMAPFFRAHWPTSAARWLHPDGTPPEPGERVANPTWAAVLDELVAAGAGAGDRAGRIRAARDAWATGRVAQEIDRFVREPHRHADGRDHAGVIRAEDLAAFRASFEPAVTRDFRGTTVAKTGPWGQGPALLAALAILEPLDDALLDPSTADGVHTIAETLKLVLADREAWFGDDAPVPVDVLLSKDYAAERRTLIGDRASTELRPGRAGGTPPLPRLRTAAEYASGVAGVGEPTIESTGDLRGDTCHLDVVDRWGNIVSATPSGGWLQSSPTIPGLGFCLGTRLQMTWLEEGTPSTLAPGRRPRTTLTPTLLLRDGRAVGALGSPGGDQQDQWQLLHLLRTLVGGWSPQEAIDAPAFHTTSFPGSFWPRTWEPGGLVVEDRLGEDVIAELERRGHRVDRAGDWTLGRLSTVGRDPAAGTVHAAANPRAMQGYAAGR
ncbi:gamma-glutamyltransferase family protein [Amnibacterium kyonggiense]|nr:gamma-glutamyltransferase [Amnibacterium kyonggiense]